MTLALIRRESLDADFFALPVNARSAAPAGRPVKSPISLLVADCEDPEDPGCGGGGDTGPSPVLDVPVPTTAQPAGLFVEYFELSDLREAWIKGNPEIEVWLYGTLRGIYQGSVSAGAAALSFNSAASRAVAVDCAGDTRVDDGLWRFFDLNVTGPIRTSRPVLFANAARLQFRDLTLTGASPNVLLQERLVWLQAPYAVQVIERDDDRGGCPVPPTDRPWSVQIGVDAVSGRPIANGVSWSDVLAWVATPNDQLLYHEFANWSSLFAGGWISGAYGGVRIVNRGFPAAPLGSGDVILFREPCVLGPFQSPTC
jgi:hypothetical protein